MIKILGKYGRFTKTHPFADGSMARLLNGIVFWGWGVWGYSGIRLREWVYLGPTVSRLAVRKL